MAQGAVYAFEQRKTSLENLVRLHGQQYFAGPKMPRDLRKEVDRRAQQRKADELVGKQMTRRGNTDGRS